jgi:hypothetical protein
LNRIVLILTILLFLTVGCMPTSQPLTTQVSTIPQTVPSPTPIQTQPVPTLNPTFIQASPTREPMHITDSFYRMIPTITPGVHTTYPTGQVFLYPGPLHYEGDFLTAEIPLIGSRNNIKARVSIDNGETIDIEHQIAINPALTSIAIVLPDFWDTSRQAGLHTLYIQTLINGVSFDFNLDVHILPASQRPAQELELAWETAIRECCTVHYLKGTAADRDLSAILDDIERNVKVVEDVFQFEFEPQVFTIYLVDKAWGNGGYAFSGGIVINYLDRAYGPAQNLDQLLRHEMTHTAMSILNFNPAMGPMMGEGIPVFVAGGHYNEEPVRERAAALLDLDMAVPIEALFYQFGALQHEARYLQSAAAVAFLAEQCGWEQVVHIGTNVIPQAQDSWDWFQKSLAQVCGFTKQQLEDEFVDWLRLVNPGGQVDHLQLTIELNNLRRDYQLCCAPSLDYTSLGPDPLEAASLPVFVREGRSPENIAIEVMIGQAQSALHAGDYDRARMIMKALRPSILETDFSFEPARDIRDIATLLLKHGYEAVQVDLVGDQADAAAIRVQPLLETVRLDKVDGRWSLVP